MDGDNALQESFSLYQRERSVITRVRERYGMNKSAALQYIINDWAAEKGFSEEAVLPEVPSEPVSPRRVRRGRKAAVPQISGVRKGASQQKTGTS